MSYTVKYTDRHGNNVSISFDEFKKLSIWLNTWIDVIDNIQIIKGTK